MKNIFLIILIATSISSSAQTAPVDTSLNKFIGTWRWTSGTDTVLIVLEKQVHVMVYTGVHSEMIVGWHKYVKNGVLVQSSMQYVGRNINIDFNSTDTDLKNTIRGNTYPSDPNRLFCYTFWDLSLHKSFELFFNYIGGNPVQAQWELSQQRGIYAGPPGLNGVFTLPKNLVLTKQ